MGSQITVKSNQDLRISKKTTTRSRYTRLILPLLGSLTLLAACVPAPTTPVESPSAQESPTPEPSPSASPRPSARPTSRPSATPSASPSLTPTSPPTPRPELPQGSPSDLEGKLFDFSGTLLKEVRVEVRSLDSSWSYSKNILSEDGSFRFEQAPAGVQLKITASKPGFASRSRVVVLKAYADGPAVNRFDFGTDGSPASTGSLLSALTDTPEVIRVSPTQGAGEVAVTTAIKLTFSEPMDRQSVEESFAIRSFAPIRLTVDKGAGFETFKGKSALDSLSNDRVWEHEAFAISWNEDGTEATFSFKPGFALPSDTDADHLPVYQLIFNSSHGRTIRDAGGAARSKFHFRLSETSLEESSSFSVSPEQTAPVLDELTVESEENEGDDGDALRVKFSEAMILRTLTHSIAGGLAGRNRILRALEQAPADHPEAAYDDPDATAAKNYSVEVTPVSGAAWAMSWQLLGGSVLYDIYDPEAKTVVLLPPVQGQLHVDVSGAPAGGAAIGASAVARDGSELTLKTLALRTQSVQDRDHVHAAADLTVAASETLIFHYTDGSSESNIDLPTPAENNYQALIEALGSLTDGGTSDWDYSEFQATDEEDPEFSEDNPPLEGNDEIEEGDRLDISLDESASRNDKDIAWVELKGGVFGIGQLNMPGYAVVTSPPRAVEAALNAGLDVSGGLFTLKESDESGGPGVLARNDRLTFKLGAAPTVGGKLLHSFTIQPNGVFAKEALHAPEQGLKIYPDTPAFARVNLFGPGDTVKLTLAKTIMDPAGNPLNPGRLSLSETAE
ncbi:MAG: Ig-like domain-containing protein [Candidatus Sericytochromatia bacterium]